MNRQAPPNNGDSSNVGANERISDARGHVSARRDRCVGADRRRGRRGREQLDVVAFKAGRRRARNSRLRDDDEIEAGHAACGAGRSREPDASPGCGRPRRQLARGGDTEPRCRRAPFAQEEHGHEAAMVLHALLVDVLELGPPADALVRPKRRHADPAPSRLGSPERDARRDGQALPALGATALQHEPAVLRAHAHEEAVGLARGGGYWAGKYASWIIQARTVARHSTVRQNLDSCVVARRRERVNKAGASNACGIVRPLPMRRAVCYDLAVGSSADRRRRAGFSTTVEKTVENGAFATGASCTPCASGFCVGEGRQMAFLSTVFRLVTRHGASQTRHTGESVGSPCILARWSDRDRPGRADDIWDQVLARVETKVNRHSFYTWFKPTTSSATRRRLMVRVPDALFRDWLLKHYPASSPRRWPKSAGPARRRLRDRADGAEHVPSRRAADEPPMPSTEDPSTRRRSRRPRAGRA